MDNNQTWISSEKEEQVRNWLDLPYDVLSLIFLKLGAMDVLFNAQSVCSVWRQVSKEPLLFRSIDISLDMQNRWEQVCSFKDHLYCMEKTATKGVIRLNGSLEINIKYYMEKYVEKMAKEAVDRSCGQLAKLSMEGFGRNDLLAYIADKSGSLRYLRLVSCFQVTDNALIKLASKAVMLEELEICNCDFAVFSVERLETVGKLCPRLKSFRLDRGGYGWAHTRCDEEALAIAKNMPQLRHLHLFGNKLTNVGLRAIVDGCLHLEYLDLRKCFNVIPEGNLLKNLLKRCRDRLIKIRLPNDSTDDYEFDGFYKLFESDND